MSRRIPSARLYCARSACASFVRFFVMLAIACLLLSPIAGRAAPAAPNDRMVVEAKEMVYNRDTNTVAASGNVQIFYKGRLLEADRVTYNQKTQQVLAEGNARLTERDGSVVRADKFELTDDFKAGFIDSLQYDTTEKTHMSSARGELIDDYRVFEKGSYTACEAWRNDPSRPRLWQIKAKRIIHDAKEKMVYYEDASFEFRSQDHTSELQSHHKLESRLPHE